MIPKAGFLSRFIPKNNKFLLSLAITLLLSANADCGPLFLLKDSLWRIKNSGSYAGYLQFLKNQGYDGLDLEIADDQGNLYFSSPLLGKLRWNNSGDSLGDFLKELSSGHDRSKPGMRVCLDLETVSRKTEEEEKARRPSGRQFADLFLDLQELYRFSDLTVSPLPVEGQSLLYWTAEASKTGLNVIAEEPEFYNTLADLSKDKQEERMALRFIVFDRTPSPAQDSSGRGPVSIGFGDLVFSLGKSLNKEVWAACETGKGFPPQCEHNVLLYRDVQYSASGFMLVPEGDDSWALDQKSSYFRENVKKDLLEFYGKSERKEVANLVLSSQSSQKARPAYFIDPIVNALLANGYDIRVTFGRILKGADLYYVVNSDEWTVNLPFANELARLLDYHKSHFYGKVILHPMGEIQDSGVWNNIREEFKIPSTEKGWVNYLPETVEYHGKALSWKGGPRNAPDSGMTFIREPQVSGSGGDVVLSQAFNGETYALILKAGEHFLVNGNYLHLQSGFFLSGMVGGALRSPAMAYVTSGRNITSALAVSDTVLKIAFPSPETPSQIRMLLFDSRGNRTQDSVLEGEKEFRIPLKPFELVILECKYK